ncbi:FAD-dependent monooxygenase [Marinicella meishanensis]|uniref:FAD-dependent monooxygenase n=1 Tax=Marinicella meishanensis TaxID=2873263 RepID=UPI001CC012A0|nr:FAD-dependent monooxygenase [Marinicella sp. NBU2979]
MSDCDVIINGGGMVGAITALLLAGPIDGEGRQVLVIESQAATQFDPSGPRQLRVSAIAQQNLQLFDRLGVLSHMDPERLGRYHHMRVWDNQSTGELSFEGEGEAGLGAMVENHHIIAAAQQQMVNHPRITVRYQAAIDSFTGTERKVRVQLADGESINAAVLVGADGARSSIRQAAGIEFKQKSYQQHGLVCYLSLEKAPPHTALQAFNPGGPVGLLPMNGSLFSMVWSLPEAQVEQWLSATDERFINALQVHINRDFGRIQLHSERQAFPLIQSYADRYHQDRVVLVGDAAHTIHPLAGQGVNLGFGDAVVLAEKLTGVALRDSEALTRALRQYQRARQAEVFKTSELMSALHHLFNNQSPPVKALRALGMNSLNRLNPLKSWLLHQAGS